MAKSFTRKINDFLQYEKLTEFQKRQYKAGLVDIYGNLTEEGVTTLLRLLADNHAEELASIADKKIAAEKE